MHTHAYMPHQARERTLAFFGALWHEAAQWGDVTWLKALLRQGGDTELAALVSHLITASLESPPSGSEVPDMVGLGLEALEAAHMISPGLQAITNVASQVALLAFQKLQEGVSGMSAITAVKMVRVAVEVFEMMPKDFSTKVRNLPCVLKITRSLHFVG